MKNSPPAASFCTVPTRGDGEAGTNYRGPDVRKGARGPTVLYMFLSYPVVSLFVNCTHPGSRSRSRRLWCDSKDNHTESLDLKICGYVLHNKAGLVQELGGWECE
jgi:hypothetical protein